MHRVPKCLYLCHKKGKRVMLCSLSNGQLILYVLLHSEPMSQVWAAGMLVVLQPPSV